MTDTIRDRANMEILDVWKNVNRQVFGREKKQIAVFPETIVPNTQRDTGTEVNVDKSIEQMNKIMEGKLLPLELFIERILKSEKELFTGRAEVNKIITEVTSTADIIPIWNQIVRYYKQPGLSRDSQEKIKVSLQQLKSNLDSLVYGYRLAMDESFQKIGNVPDLADLTSIALLIMELLRAESVYKAIAEQVNSTGFMILDTELLNSAYKNNLQSLSQNEMAFIKAHAPRSGIMPTGVRNIPDFGSQTTVQRLKAIQDELGIRFSEQQLSALRKMPMNQLNEELDRLRGAKPEAGKNLALIEKRAELEIDLSQYAQMYNILNAEIESLKSDKVVQPQPPIPVPDIPVVRRLVLVEGHEEKYEQQREQWQQKMEERRQAILERNRIVSINEHNENLQRSRDEKDELIRQKERDLDELQGRWAETVEKLANLTEELKGVVRENPSLEDFARQFPVEGFGKPKSARVDTRGLAGIRENYGKPEESESESESESDEGDSSDEGGAMDFDDDRNEHYTRRPVPYY